MVVYENALDFKKKVPSAPTLGPVFPLLKFNEIALI
jgi:hypothetical protein